MAGPSQKPAAARRPQTVVPHPDDVDALREAFEQAERGEFLSAEESAAHLKQLLGDDPSST